MEAVRRPSPVTGARANNQRQAPGTCSACGRKNVKTFQEGRCYDCQVAVVSPFRGMLDDALNRVHAGGNK